MSLLSKELIKRIRKLEIKMSRLVDEVMAGEYHSVFKGQGVEFAEVRKYEFGDDVRSIDWNVTARMGSPYIKKFIEERELFVYLIVDMSASGLFSTAQKSKSAVMAELSALLAFCAIKNNDQIGLILFCDGVEKFVRVGKGKRHVLRIIREILRHKPQGVKTNVAAALEYMNKIAKRRSIVFLISDFIADDFTRPLKVASKKHDFIGITVSDPREREFEDVGIVTFESAESKELVTVDTSEKNFLKNFKDNAENRKRALEKIFKKYKVDNIQISTDEPYLPPLIKYFKKRAKRL